MDIFPFHLTNDPFPAEGYRPAQARVSASRTGKKFRLVRGDHLEYRLSAVVSFPQPGSSAQTLDEWHTFLADNKAATFLVMPYTGVALRRESTSFVATAGQTTFPFHHKHIDEGSATVTVNGTPVSISSFTTTGTGHRAAVIAACAGGETVVISTNFYVPCIFNKLEDAEGLGDESALEDAPRAFEIELVETQPGARFTDPATAPKGA